VIGRNGAGKSTLLKVLTRITEPTKGEVDLYGRVASLLEVGTGFHPELTGRENIYLNGAILGMRRAEIDRKFDEIVAFAEVETFLDTPVKHFSSGLYVRLAFAVAAHLEPEILLVDEVLAVGDGEFQKKCLGKMGEVATGGRTVVLVSHNLAAIESICQRAIMLSEGTLCKTGPVVEVLGAYRALGGPNREFIRCSSAHLRWRGLLNRTVLTSLIPADDLALEIGFASGGTALRGLSVDIALVNERNEWVLHAKSRHVHTPFNVAANSSVTIAFTFYKPQLAPGNYRLIVYAYAGHEVLGWIEEIDACSIQAQPPFEVSGVFDGIRSAVMPVYKVDLVGQE